MDTFTETMIDKAEARGNLARGAAAEVKRRVEARRLGPVEAAALMAGLVYMGTDVGREAAELGEGGAHDEFGAARPSRHGGDPLALNRDAIRFLTPAARKQAADDPVVFLCDLVAGGVLAPKRAGGGNPASDLAGVLRFEVGHLDPTAMAGAIVERVRAREFRDWLHPDLRPERPGWEQRTIDLLAEFRRRGWLASDVDVEELAVQPGFVSMGNLPTWEAARLLADRLFGPQTGGIASYGNLAGNVEPDRRDDLFRRPRVNAPAEGSDDDADPAVAEIDALYDPAVF